MVRLTINKSPVIGLRVKKRLLRKYLSVELKATLCLIANYKTR